MSRYIIFLILVLVTSLSFSQEKEIKGQVINDRDIAGIYIKNQTSRHHAVTHADGSFKIKAKMNDTLLVTSIVYKPQQIIVSEIAYTQEMLTITLEEVVNELNEVKVGSLLTEEERDQLNKVKDDLKDDMSWEKMEFDYEFTQDKNSSIVGNKAHEAFFNGQQQNDGVKLHMIIPAVINFLKRKETEVLPQLPKEVVRQFLKARFTKQDLQTYFKIQPKNAEDFLFYLVEEGVPDLFLDPDNEMNLVQLINDKAKIYNAQAKK